MRQNEIEPRNFQAAFLRSVLYSLFILALKRPPCVQNKNLSLKILPTLLIFNFLIYSRGFGKQGFQCQGKLSGIPRSH